jgi:hypothetical protein
MIKNKGEGLFDVFLKEKKCEISAFAGNHTNVRVNSKQRSLIFSGGYL